MADSFSVRPRRSIPILFSLLTGLISAIGTGDCAAQVYYRVTPSYYPRTPAYYPYTIARAQDRTWIRNLPMEKRPDRPLHFYGNRMRRSYSVQRPGYSPQPRIQTNLVRGYPRQTRL